MSGHRPFSDLTKYFSPERQARIDEKVHTLKQAMALADLREARAHSQADLATSLHVQLPAVAKMERRTDMYVSNLRRYIEALGGCDAHARAEWDLPSAVVVQRRHAGRCGKERGTA